MNRYDMLIVSAARLLMYKHHESLNGVNLANFCLGDVFSKRNLEYLRLKNLKNDDFCCNEKINDQICRIISGESADYKKLYDNIIDSIDERIYRDIDKEVGQIEYFNEILLGAKLQLPPYPRISDFIRK